MLTRRQFGSAVAAGRTATFGSEYLRFYAVANKPLRQFHEPTEKSWEKGRFKVTQNDLRRTFLSVAQRLELSHNIYQALCNRSERNSRWDRHVEIDVEQLREPMQRITDQFLELVSVKRPADAITSVVVVEEETEEVYV